MSRFYGSVCIFDKLIQKSGFRQGHSTETAVLRVLSDILQAVGRGDLAALVLLDLSAAFDTVDHSILLERLQFLQQTFGISDTALCWFQSYVPVVQDSVRASRSQQVISHLPDLRRATRIRPGSNPFRLV